MNVETAVQGLNCLRAFFANQLPSVSSPIGYTPHIIWGVTEETNTLPRDKIFVMAINTFSSITRANIGYPARFEVLGAFEIRFYTTEQQDMRAIDTVATDVEASFYTQVRLRPFVVESSLINDIEPLEKWIGKQVIINYRFQYFVREETNQ